MTAASLTPEAALGLGLKHLEAGQPDAAAGAFAAVIAAVPGHTQAVYLLGISLLNAGRAAEALTHLTQASVLAPGHWSICLAQASAFDRLGRFGEAATALRRAVSLAPDAGQALAALSSMIERLAEASGRPDRLARRALAAGFSAGDAASCFNLARALMAGGDAVPAARLLRHGLVMQPAMPDIANALCILALESSQADATRRARIALALAPERTDYRFHLAACLSHAGDTDGAARTFRQVLAIAPDHAPALNNLGLVLRNQSLIPPAVVAHRRALALQPRNASMHRNHLSTLLYTAGGEQEHFAAHLAFGHAVAQARRPPHLPRPPKDRLTIGYLSADLRNHPVGHLLEPVLGGHDRSRFRIGLYMQGGRPDEVSRRLMAMADYVCEVTELDDVAAAQRMRADGVDVLVVVAGHFDQNRPGIAAQRAAPVQVSLYDAATSGIAEMDYLIADPVLAPRAGSERFVERVVRVPRLLVSTLPPPLPCDRRGGSTPVFGSFSAPAKLSPATLDLWARLLVRVPTARLVLKSYNLFASQTLADRVRGVFADAGVADRLECRSAAEPIDRHLANYRDIDVALDPFPFNGSTTTYEAFWMGVPVVTLLGERMPGRWTAPMLDAVGLSDLVARDASEYVDIAGRLAADRDRLASLRTTLRDRVLASSLADGRGRARQFERLYRAMWSRA